MSSFLRNRMSDLGSRHDSGALRRRTPRLTDWGTTWGRIQGSGRISPSCIEAELTSSEEGKNKRGQLFEKNKKMRALVRERTTSTSTHSFFRKSKSLTDVILQRDNHGGTNSEEEFLGGGQGETKQ